MFSQITSFSPAMRMSAGISHIESRLTALGMKRHNIASELCRRAKIDATTYRRWRNGDTIPNMASWLAVERAAAKIEKEAQDGKHILARRRRRKARKARS